MDFLVNVFIIMIIRYLMMIPFGDLESEITQKNVNKI